MRRGWRGGVKERLVAVSVLGVAVALALGILTFANLLNRSLVAHLGASTDAAASAAASVDAPRCATRERLRRLAKVRIPNASATATPSTDTATSRSLTPPRQPRLILVHHPRYRDRGAH